MQTIRATWLTALALCAASAASGEIGDYARRGLYVGVGAAYVIEQFDLPDEVVRAPESPISLRDVEGGDSWGAEARVGYRIHPNVATEGQLQYYDNFAIDVAHDGRPMSPLRKALTLNGLSLMANVKGYPFTGRVQPYALGGLGLLWLHAQGSRPPSDDFFYMRAGFEDNDVQFAGRIGGGIDGYITRNLLLNVEVSFVLPTGNLHDFRMVPISLGVQYRFD